MANRRILFIVNPISGHHDKRRFREQVAREFGGGDFSCEVVFTERAGHAAELSAEAVGVYDVVAAVGGDGTLNEVARNLVDTDTVLAVIPCGSGNGLARCLHIPTDTGRALRLLRNGSVRRIDTATVNGRFFLSVAGIGLDAQTAYDFDQDPRRGFMTYAHYVATNYFHYKPDTVTIAFDGGEPVTCCPFLITFANSNQYGYNAVIAPHASLQDGLIDVCMLSRPTLLSIPSTVTRLLHGRLDKTGYLTEVQAKTITVERPAPGVVNIDGDPVMMDAFLDVRILPHSLNIIVT